MGIAATTEDVIYDMFKLAIIEYLFHVAGHIMPGSGAALVLLVMVYLKYRKERRSFDGDSNRDSDRTYIRRRPTNHHP